MIKTGNTQEQFKQYVNDALDKMDIEKVEINYPQDVYVGDTGFMASPNVITYVIEIRGSEKIKVDYND